LRNLRKFPVTDEEIIDYIRKIRVQASNDLDEKPPGDMDLAILNKLYSRYQELLEIEYEFVDKA
jgi:hypothetical protein